MQNGCVIEIGKIYVESTILVLQNDFRAEQSRELSTWALVFAQLLYDAIFY